MPTLTNFHLKQNDTWTSVTFDKTNGHIKNIQNDEALTLEPSCVYACMDHGGRQVFWIIKHTEDDIFRVDWLPHPNHDTPSNWMRWKDDKRSALPDEIKSLFSEVALEPIRASYEASRHEPVLPIENTDGQREVEQGAVRPADSVQTEQDVRPPDRVRTERLIGGYEDHIYHHESISQPEITDFDSLVNALLDDNESPDRYPVLFSTTNIQLSAEQLKALLNLLDHKLEIIEALQDKLPGIIQNGPDLTQVLEELADEPSKRILNIMKGKLPHMMTQDIDVDQKIKTALEGSKQGFFATPRAEKINVGSLTSKLEKYIETRKKEYSFHWDFLHIMTALNWLFGEAFVQSKETKLNAAHYALLSHTHPEQSLVKLQALQNMPTETELNEQHKNSYLLITNHNAPNTLYYIDYEGKSREVRVQTLSEDGLAQFFRDRVDQHLTYQEISQDLKNMVAHKLPTDAQLEALKEGLLGDIMTGSEEGAILNGTHRPSAPSANEQNTL
ncbi:MAG: hypothetical protein P1U36_09155 [Legionellaceae bacterium]|nr:hypothetical protein [Legionellaceae bacterium]